MAIISRDEITLSCIVDVEAITRYYKLQSSTLAKPSAPTTNPPSGWTDTEPSYTEGSTNSLYHVELVEFSDGTWNYSNVSLSSSYEASKIAYNKSQSAENVANSTQDSLEELDESTNNRFDETFSLINEVQETSQQYTRTIVQDYAKITDLDETKSSLSSEISATAENIKMEVSNTYMAITKEEEIYATIRSMIEQSEADITMTFRSELSNVENTVEINKQNIEDYIRFSADGIEIGERNSPFKSNFSNTELSFSQNGEVIAYISNSTMYIKNAHVTERFTLGRISTGYYDLTVGNDTHLTWTYREEGSGS